MNRYCLLYLSLFLSLWIYLSLICVPSGFWLTNFSLSSLQKPFLSDKHINNIIEQIASPSREEILIDDEKRKVLGEPSIKANNEVENEVDFLTARHQQTVEPSNRKELSDIQSLKVAFWLSKELVIRNLGLHLGIESYKLDTIFQNKKDDITEAAHEVLQEWRKRQPSSTEAYQNLLAVLKHPDVNLLHIVRDVFEESIIDKSVDSELGMKNIFVVHTKEHQVIQA